MSHMDTVYDFVKTFCRIVHCIDFSLNWCKKISKSVHWFWNYDNNYEVTDTQKSVILRNRPVKFSSYSPYWTVACFKHMLMTIINFMCVCVASVCFWCRKDWINWFRWKAKIKTWHPWWESGSVPKSERVAMRLISGGRVTFHVCIYIYIYIYIYNIYNIYI